MRFSTCHCPNFQKVTNLCSFFTVHICVAYVQKLSKIALDKAYEIFCPITGVTRNFLYYAEKHIETLSNIKSIS